MFVSSRSLFQCLKSIFDFALSLFLMIIVAIVALTLTVLNPFLNPGPLLFTQTRIGRNGREFKIYKFRTMTGESATAGFATEQEKRITPFGRFLRQKRIDELPQIFNTLKGDMSFIGPRPEQPNFVSQYRKELANYDTRHIVKPGISGLAQVEYGYTSDVAGTINKLRYDLIYIKKSGFKMELYVIWKTLLTVINGFGAR